MQGPGLLLPSEHCVWGKAVLTKVLRDGGAGTAPALTVPCGGKGRVIKVIRDAGETACLQVEVFLSE